MSAAVNLAPVARPGKYVGFILGTTEYAVEILKVHEIGAAINVTPWPGSPDIVQGMVQLRGRKLPVIDPHRRLGCRDGEQTERTSLLVVQLDHNDHAPMVALLVDEVTEIFNLAQDQIEPPPSGAGGPAPEFIAGRGRRNGRHLDLLDLDRVLNSEEIETVTRLGS